MSTQPVEPERPKLDGSGFLDRDYLDEQTRKRRDAKALWPSRPVDVPTSNSAWMQEQDAIHAKKLEQAKAQLNAKCGPRHPPCWPEDSSLDVEELYVS